MKRRWPDLLLALAVVVAAWSWSSQQISALGSFRLQWGQDLAFFNQILHHAATGQAWTSSLLLEPTGFLEMVHFHPVFALVLPFYVLFPGTKLLLGLNVLAVSLAAWPLSRLGREVSRSELFGLACGLAWLVWVPAACAARADFRPMVFLVPGLAWLLLGVWTGKRLHWVGGAILCALAREESAYLLTAAGLVLLVVPFGGKKRKEGFGLLGMGLAWLGFLLAFKSNFFFHFNPLEVLGGSGVPSSVAPELAAERASFLFRLWMGGYLAAPLAPASLLVGLGPLGWLVTDSHREWHAMTGTTVYLRDVVLVLIAASGTVGAGMLVRRYTRALIPVSVVMVLANAAAFFPERGRLSEFYVGIGEEAGSDEVREIHGLLERVPDEARVATDYRLVAALSGRRVLWNIAHLYMDDGRPHHWVADWPLTLDRVDAVVVLQDSGFAQRLQEDWTLEATGGGYGYWARVALPAAGMPEPLP